ncbi:MAG: recombination mediator RecR [Parachlamydiaceae bacterium]|nr:recombination mediator RecR [Parachlamydiaceae bacterium]
MRYPEHLLKLIEVLKKFPGVGNKSAERFAFHLLNWSEDQLKEMGTVLSTVKENLHHCSLCGCLMDHHGCQFCDTSRRRCDTLCIISSPRDVFAIEGTHEFKGLYHVLKGLLSPMNHRGPEFLNLDSLKNRITTFNIKEIIIALDSTLEGDATSLYLKQELSSLPVSISRLAFGIPMGSSIDYVDGGTLARALSARSKY